MISPPPLQVPISAPTGGLTAAWIAWFDQLRNDVSASEDSDYLKAPDAVSLTAAVTAALHAITQELQTRPLIGDLHAQIQQLYAAVQALSVAPVYTPQLRGRPYGTFHDTTTQTAAAINTAYGITFNTTDLSSGVYVGAPTSRIYVARGGIYNIQFSIQLDNTSGGNHLVFIWLRINNADIADSASQVRLKGTDGELVAAWNFVQQLVAGDYFELMWSVDDTAVQILAQAAAAPVPAIPSAILTVTDNISADQD